ncbi:MAG TPA: hypothetical protein VHW09_24125 [Bryobacteraceae bacterium]|nr:hypothetical protein [Bryobacteraceae bacterium]
MIFLNCFGRIRDKVSSMRPPPTTLARNAGSAGSPPAFLDEGRQIWLKFAPSECQVFLSYVVLYFRNENDAEPGIVPGCAEFIGDGDFGAYAQRSAFLRGKIS